LPRIPREVVDAVRDRTDLVELVSRHVSLARRGRSHVGLCPFHQEKSPSFHVIPDKGIYHCFGCQAGGDAFKFLMTIEGLSFVEAVKELAGPAGVEIAERELTDAERRALKQRATLFDVLEAAASWYESVLWTRPEGAPGRAYLAGRALTEETQRSARLGYAPEGWTRLVDYLHQQGFSPNLVEQAGLAKPRKQGDGRYDVMRERVIIPITDERGRVIAFGGRLLEGDGPKYLNTPETRLYKKSSVLYGLHAARNGIGRAKRALVVEGYFDVISLAQAGFPETVATCGTALTADHLERIRRLTRDVVLVLDSDAAGTAAAERTLPLFVAAGIQPWRLDLPGAKDPDELVREEGPEALEKALAGKEPLFEWVVQRKLSGYGASAMSRERVLDEVLPMLRQLADPTLVSRVARRLGLHEQVVFTKLREAPPPRNHAAPAPPRPAGWKPHVDIVHVLWLLVHRRDEVADLLARANPDLFAAHTIVRPTIARLLAGEPVAAILEDVHDEGLQRTLRAVVARQELYTREEAPAAMVNVLVRLYRPLHNRAMAVINRELPRALASSDFARYRELGATKKQLDPLGKRLEHPGLTKDLPTALDLLDKAAAAAVNAAPTVELPEPEAGPATEPGEVAEAPEPPAVEDDGPPPMPDDAPYPDDLVPAEVEGQEGWD